MKNTEVNIDMFTCFIKWSFKLVFWHHIILCSLSCFQARYVAAAANHLVESAQALVAVRTSMLENADHDFSTQNLKPEALISAAQTTAACTAHLVVACVAKADPTSASCTGLRKAGSAVKRAVENLVKIVEDFYASNVQLSMGAQENILGTSFEGLSASVVSSMRQVDWSRWSAPS